MGNEIRWFRFLFFYYVLFDLFTSNVLYLNWLRFKSWRAGKLNHTQTQSMSWNSKPEKKKLQILLIIVCRFITTTVVDSFSLNTLGITTLPCSLKLRTPSLCLQSLQLAAFLHHQLSLHLHQHHHRHPRHHLCNRRHPSHWQRQKENKRQRHSGSPLWQLLFVLELCYCSNYCTSVWLTSVRDCGHTYLSESPCICGDLSSSDLDLPGSLCFSGLFIFFLLHWEHLLIHWATSGLMVFQKNLPETNSWILTQHHDNENECDQQFFKGVDWSSHAKVTMGRCSSLPGWAVIVIIRVRFCYQENGMIC